MKLEYENTIFCTKEEAWKFATDLERRPDWISFQEKCFWLEKKEGMIGSTYQEKEVFLGIPLNIKYEITEWKQYEQMSSKCLMPPFYPIIDIIIKEKAKGIEAKLIMNVKLGPFELMPKFLLKSQIDKLIIPFTDEFKVILERETSLKK